MNDVSPADPMHGSTVLLLIDVINPLDFDGAQDLAQPAINAARAIARLRRRPQLKGVQAIYANDNYGIWQSDFKSLSHAIAPWECRLLLARKQVDLPLRRKPCPPRRKARAAPQSRVGALQIPMKRSPS